MMSGWVETWYLSVGTAAVGVVMSLFSAAQMKAALAATEGGLRGRDQLPVLRRAIETSMRLAALFILLYAALLTSLMAGVAKGWLGMPDLCIHLLVFGVLTGPVGMWTRTFEKRLQALDASGGEPGVADVYARWLQEWKKPRLTLSEP